MPEHKDHDLRQRDSASLIMLGGFFCVLGVLVLFGSYWAMGRPHAMIVNLAAGTLLLAVGVVMVWIGLRMRRPRPDSEGDRGEPSP